MFRKYSAFSILVAISNSKCIGWTVFEKGAMNKERLVEFMKECIFRKYKDHLIVMDNAGGHRNNYVWDAITESVLKQINIYILCLIHQSQIQ
jgi:hypothetical protein